MWRKNPALLQNARTYCLGALVTVQLSCKSAGGKADWRFFGDKGLFRLPGRGPYVGLLVPFAVTEWPIKFATFNESSARTISKTMTVDEQDNMASSNLDAELINQQDRGVVSGQDSFSHKQDESNAFVDVESSETKIVGEVNSSAAPVTCEKTSLEDEAVTEVANVVEEEHSTLSPSPTFHRRRASDNELDEIGNGFQPLLSTAQQSFHSSGCNRSMLLDIDTTELINMVTAETGEITESEKEEMVSNADESSLGIHVVDEHLNRSQVSLVATNLEQDRSIARGISMKSLHADATHGATTSGDVMDSKSHSSIRSHSASGYDDSSSDHTGSEFGPHEANKQRNLASTESKEVQRWLFGVVSLLVIVCIAVLTTVYLVLSDAQEGEFLASVRTISSQNVKAHRSRLSVPTKRNVHIRSIKILI